MNFRTNTLKSFLFIYLITVLSINFSSCNSNLVDPEYYDDASYYYYENGKITLYPSNSLLLLKFKDSTTLDIAKEIIRKYHLELPSLYPGGINYESLLNANQPIVIKIPKGRNPFNNFITKYPKINYSSPRLGNLPEVEYCLQTYSTDGSKYVSRRVFFTNRISFKVADSSVSIDDLLNRYGLRLIPTEYMGQDVYLCELTDYSPKDPLRTANELHENPNVIWSEPDFIGFYWLD